MEKNAQVENARMLIERSPDIMGVIDRDTLAIEEMNPAFTTILGYTTEEVLGKTITSFLAPDEGKKFAEMTVGENESYSFDTKITARDGDLKWLAWNVVVRPDKFLVWGRDVTEVRVLDATLRKSTDQLEAVNKELESFAYSVSHDLRAPLRAIHGNARAIEEDCIEILDEAALTYLRKILNNATKLDKLINELVAYSRMGRKEVRKTAVDMTHLAQEVFKEISKSQPHRATFAPGAMPEAFGDLSMLRVVWTNLLSNAVKYSSRKENPQIEVGAAAKDGVTEYFIRDNGAGFDMAYAGKLFGTFQRLHDDSEFEGVGIGLAVAKRIIVKHGGAIRVEAAPEQGATFYFTLPPSGKMAL